LAGDLWLILGRMTEASDDAEADDVPGEVCSVRMVVSWATHALESVSWVEQGRGGCLLEHLRRRSRAGRHFTEVCVYRIESWLYTRAMVSQRVEQEGKRVCCRIECRTKLMLMQLRHCRLNGLSFFRSDHLVDCPPDARQNAPVLGRQRACGIMTTTNVKQEVVELRRILRSRREDA
jgi:hypothetical protein